MKQLTDEQIIAAFNKVESETPGWRQQSLHAYKILIAEFCRINGITSEAQPAEQANGQEAVASDRFVFRAVHPHGPNVLDKQTGRWMSPDLVREMASVLPTPPAQPAREWVGLTEGEQLTMWAGDNPRPTLGKNKVLEFARAIESKLREKNAGQPAADEKAGGEPVSAIPDSLRIALEDFDSMEPLGPTTEAVIDAAQKWYLAASRYTHPQPQAEVRVPDGYVLVPKSALRWLFGEEDAFECRPEKYFRGKPPTYWWRSVFRDMLAAAPKPQDDLPAILKKQAS